MSVSLQCLIKFVVLHKLKGKLRCHFLYVYQNRLFQPSTLFVHLTSNFVFGCEIWLESELNWFVSNFDEN